MSSASKPFNSTPGICMAFITSVIKGSCDLNSSGLFALFALYSGNISFRNVSLDTSKAIAKCVGFSSFIALISIEVKPKTAFVGWPELVAKLSNGNA